MGKENYRPRYGSKTFRVLERVYQEEVRKSGDEYSVCFSRLCAAGLIRRKDTGFKTCPYYYYITDKGKAVFKDIKEKEDKKSREERIFNTF